MKKQAAILKTTAALLALAVFILPFYASGSGWFMSEAVIGEGIAGFSAAASFRAGDAFSFENSRAEEIFLSKEQQEILLTAAAAGSFQEAEAELGALAQAGEGASDGADNLYGYRAYRITYRFQYEENGADPAKAYLRVGAAGKHPNSIRIGGEEQFCLQHVAYARAGSEPEQAPRLAFAGEDAYYYYPYPVEAGDEILFTYTLFLPEDTLSDPDRIEAALAGYDLIFASNNAAVIRWNVLFEEGGVYPFDSSTLERGDYYDYAIEFEAIAEAEEEIGEEEAAPEEEEETGLDESAGTEPQEGTEPGGETKEDPAGETEGKELPAEENPVSPEPEGGQMNQTGEASGEIHAPPGETVENEP